MPPAGRSPRAELARRRLRAFRHHLADRLIEDGDAALDFFERRAMRQIATIDPAEPNDARFRPQRPLEIVP
jgi:hypothetical protein